MAMSIRKLCKPNIGLINNLFSKTQVLSGARFIYSEKSLGVTSYEHTRFLFRNQFIAIEDTFRSKMEDVSNKEGGVIFTEDIKAMLHLAQKADSAVVNKMIEKYVQCDQTMKFGTYTFGPIVMRMYYYLNDPHAALAVFKNPVLEEFFLQKTSYQILMTLLYNNKMYQEVKDVYEHILNAENRHGLSKFCLVGAMVACYKQNTPEALEDALRYWKSLKTYGYYPSTRSTTLLAALALHQGSVQMALEILATLDRQHFIDCRCLKVLAFIRLKKFVQIIPIIRHVLESDYSNRKLTFYADVIYALEESLKEENSKESLELQQLIIQLKQEERLTSHITLDESLLKPIHFQTRSDREKLKDNSNMQDSNNRISGRSQI
ncbi:pentatricopeptide repeat-containing protein 2, mitochondrial-like [Colletes gigas]|uniref:pentatricopeptide repeat-containing protein 2, mitochondrial-like n=1 Tax=Colletes gigas TaxID=935657 RepID=UPI001C9AB349|nr:pentatricopeptide repeat-containing protein 2, mitochondrial-like [Colletes gigas]